MQQQDTSIQYKLVCKNNNVTTFIQNRQLCDQIGQNLIN